MKIQAIIFDFFGVIYDDPIAPLLASMSPHKIAAIKVICQKLDLGQIDYKQYVDHIALTLEVPSNELRNCFEKTQPRREVIALLRKISAQIPLALLSNAASEEVRPRLQSCGIAPLFKEVLISAEIGRAKPDPEIFLLCCKRLGLAPQSCLFIDDRSANVIAAKQLGMQTMLFKNSPGLQSKISKYCPSLMLDFDQ